MTHKDKNNYSGKHASDRPVDRAIAAAVRKRTKEGKISCADAFRISEDLNTTASEVGFTIDALESRIMACQLGLFGHKFGKALNNIEIIPDDLKSAVLGSQENECLRCQDAWEIAKGLGIKKIAVSSACESMKVKITSCQLGAF